MELAGRVVVFAVLVGALGGRIGGRRRHRVRLVNGFVGQTQRRNGRSFRSLAICRPPPKATKWKRTSNRIATNSLKPAAEYLKIIKGKLEAARNPIKPGQFKLN